MTWLGPLLFVYIAVSTVCWAGVKLWEERHPHQKDGHIRLKWWFILAWWTILLMVPYQKAMMRWDAWRIKRMVYKILPDHKELADQLAERIKEL